MSPPAHRMSVFRRRNIILFLCSAACLYFLIALISSYVTVKELSQPPYGLFNIKKEVENEMVSNILSDSKSSAPNTKFLPSIFATSNVLEELLRSHYYLARVLAHDDGSQNFQSNQSIFGCICGRVSDDCVCCGTLKTPPSGIFMKKPLILFAAGDSAPATFCLNITYLPKKQSVKMTGFLSPESDVVNLQKVLINQQSLSKTNFSRLLVLYDNEVVPLHSTPKVCAENSKEDPDLMLCTQLSSLRYGVESSGDHQTVFTGCMEVTVLVQKRLPVLRYPKVCFRAHRGAAGDVDQAEARADKQKTSTTGNAPIQNKISGESAISEDFQTAIGRTPNAEPTSVTEAKVHEPILFNIAHPVVP